MDSRGCPCWAFCFAALRGDGAEASERMLERGEGSTWENWTDSVLSKNCPAGFCATGDLVSVCSFAFLDGLAGLHLKFTVTLHLGRQKERHQNGRWGSHRRHPHAVGLRREGHSAGLQWGQYVFLFEDSREKNLCAWGMVFCGALTGFAEIELGWRREWGQAQWKQGGFYTSYSWPLWAPLYVSAALTFPLHLLNWFKSWFWSVNTWFKFVHLISFCFGISVFVFSEAISIGRRRLKYVAKYSLYTTFGTTFLLVQRMHCMPAHFLSDYLTYMHLFRWQLLRKFWFRTWQIVLFF